MQGMIMILYIDDIDDDDDVDMIVYVHTILLWWLEHFNKPIFPYCLHFFSGSHPSFYSLPLYDSSLLHPSTTTPSCRGSYHIQSLSSLITLLQVCM